MGTYNVSVEFREFFMGEEKFSRRLVSDPVNFEIREPTGVNLNAYLYMHKKLGYRNQASRRFEHDTELMQHILERFPGSLYAAYVHFGYGERNRPDRYVEMRRERVEKSVADMLRLAVEHYRKALTTYPSFQFKDRARLRLAEALMYLGEYFPARREATIVLDTAVDFDIRRKARLVLKMIPELETAAVQQK